MTTNAHAAHVAAVALAWLEGHGWAEGDALARMVATQTVHGLEAARRIVALMAPVETEEDA